LLRIHGNEETHLTSAWHFEALMSFDRFVKERKYLKNVSPRTIEWYEESFKWLGTENPSKDDLTDFVVRMRDKGLSSASCNLLQ
jgi:hypothetical protein